MLIRTLAAGILAGAAVTGYPVSGNAAAGAAGRGPGEPVIVFLNSQSGTGTGGSIRSGEEDIARQDGATGIRAYGLADAFAARMTPAAAASMAARPGVERVIPDSVINGPSPAAPAASPGPAVGPERSGVLPPTMPGACHKSPSLEPEGLGLTHTDSGDPAALTARKLGYTGAGVKVAFLADGLDPNNVNFLRDGKSAITDYQDFSGDGAGAPTGGDEAYLDANAIAGQGQHVYDVQGFGDQGPAGPCDIRIEGTAPGANVEALKVFGQRNQTTTSNFLQAIDYAVTVDHVQVLNESFGSNPFPDVTSLDAVKEFNEAATALGVTVIVASGDAGPFDTIGSPASDPDVLSAGASTAFRFYAQTDYAEANSFARAGWLDDNISALSSGGSTEDGRTVDMVAPGDLGWASCTANAKMYSQCSGFAGHPSDIEESGGTSEAAPEIAGTAALVIQAYRRSHRGTSPAPALVRQILISSATDLGAPATEQGAGLLNSYRAVRMASGLGGGPLLSESQVRFDGPAGTRHTWRVRVTNPGLYPERLSVAGRTFGAPRSVASGSVTLSDTSSPHVDSPAGTPVNYGTITFRVPRGAGRLDASAAWPVNPATAHSRKPVRLVLITPDGKLAADSLPQGNGGYGSAQVLRPAPGTWKAIVDSSTGKAGGTTGRVLVGATVSRYRSFGSVSPRSLTLAPGGSGSFTVSATAPAAGGDTSGLVVVSSADGATALPVTLRSLITLFPRTRISRVRGKATAARAGRFSGTLTGGNGRALGGGQSQAYQFTVNRGTRSLQAGITLANDPGNTVTGYLVAPSGQVMGYGTNKLITGFTAQGRPIANSERQLSVSAADPVPGTWTLLLDFAEPVPGNELADRFAGTIRTDGARASRGRLPDSAATTLTRGKTYRYPIRVTLAGPAPESLFLDPRLDRIATYRLQPQGQDTGQPLPLSATANAPEWLVPDQTQSVTAKAVSSSPVTFDFAPLNGEPDTAAGTGKSVSATYPADPLPTPVTPGLWQAFPAEAGPYPAGGAPSRTTRVSMTTRTLAFDPAMSSGSTSTGPTDFWRYAVSPMTGLASRRMFVVGPGQTRVMTATITPTAAPGTLVRGVLYVDDFADSAQFVSGSELLALPYEYRVR